MTVNIHEVSHHPIEGAALHVSLCGHDDADDGIPDGKVRHVFTTLTEGATAAEIRQDARNFATSIATTAGVEDVWLYAGIVRVNENFLNIEANPLVWIFVDPVV